MVAGARQLRREVFAAQCDAPDPAEQALVDHTLAFGRLDLLARQLRDAGAPDIAVAWTSHQADIAFRAARSDGQLSRSTR